MRLSAMTAAAAMVAATAMADDGPVVLDPVTVEGDAVPQELTEENKTGSYVGLAPIETPAAVDVVTEEEIREKGLRNLIEVYNSAPGVTSGNLPGEPGVVSMRGFSRAANGYSVDGARAVDPLLVSRNFDSFNFESIEILKGPASVIHGTGALAGAINLVTKKPVEDEAFVEGLMSFGSFDTARVGAGVNQPLGTKAAARSTLSYSRSDGYVDDTDSETVGVTSGITVEASDRLSLSAAFDYFHDTFSTPYQGAPLLPRGTAIDPSDVVSTANGFVVDEALRDRNYNVADGLMKSDTFWFRTDATYDLGGGWKIANELSIFDADRFWANSEDFTFNAGTGLFDRTTTKITHDHRFWSDRATVSNDDEIAGMRNRFAAGYEFIATEFGSVRRFGNTTSVDPFAPSRGVFPDDTPANFATRQNFDSSVDTHAVFVEDALNVTDDWLVVGGFRYERIALERRIDDLNAGTVTSFDRTFHSTSWRVGSVYDLAPGTAVFAQYNQAVIPVTTLLLSNLARASFELSTGQSVEAGVKSAFWDDRLVATASVYRVEQEDILTRDPANPALTIQGGSQRSVGFEVDVTFAPTDNWRFGINGALLDAEFTELADGAGRSLAGNRPPNVPDHTVNAFASYRLASLPLTFRVDARHVGSSFTDNANTIEMARYTVFDAAAAYDVGGGTLTLRGRNLTDAFYANWSGYSATQVFIGAPRSVDLTYEIRF